MSFLVDTDVCSAYLKGNQVAWARFMQFGGIHLSTITVGELFTWAMRAKAPPQRRTELQALLSGVSVVPIDIVVAQQFGELRAALLDAGRATPEMDLLNAATALVNDLTLVTHNVEDYAHLPGLTVVDWLQT
jgi:tRNA(fMet)-specific endonuclease VapC